MSMTKVVAIEPFVEYLVAQLITPLLQHSNVIELVEQVFHHRLLMVVTIFRSLYKLRIKPL